MHNKKISLLIGVLATTSIIGNGCKKSDTGASSATITENTTNESKAEETTKSQPKKKAFKRAETLGTIGWIDLEDDENFPKAGYIPLPYLTLGFDENKGELASCYFRNICVGKTDAEETLHVEYTDDLEKIPSILKNFPTFWNSFVEERRMYFMFSSQQYEVVVDNTEKVTYGSVDFIKEEGHIDVTRKDPSNTNYPELIRGGYIAYYYFSPKDAGQLKSDTMQGYGMGMAVWGVRPVDMSDTKEAKTMEENYEKLKKAAESSMKTFSSQEEYRSLGK